MKQERKKLWLLPLLLMAMLFLMTACGENANVVTGQNPSGNSLVAGENVTRMYAYIRDVNPQARTITVDEVTVVDGYDDKTISRMGAENAVDMMDGWYVFNPGRNRVMYPLASAVTFDLTGRTPYSRLGYESGMLSNENMGSDVSGMGSLNGDVMREDAVNEDRINNEGTGDYDNSGVYDLVTDYNDKAFDRPNTGSSESVEKDPRDYGEADRYSEGTPGSDDAYTDAGRNEDHYLLKDGTGREKDYHAGTWIDDNYAAGMNSISINRYGEKDVLYLLTVQNDRVVDITRVTAASAAV